MDVVTGGATIRRNRGWFERFGRGLRYRFVVPIKRSRHPPSYTARSVSVGLFWALTPTVGVQMALVLLNWIVFRRVIPRWDFNVIHAMAWTWVTNFATVLPVYYVFYFTGQVLLGRWDDLTGYEAFAGLWSVRFTGGATDYLAGEIDTLQAYLDVIIEGWGLALIVGCWPYAILGAWIGHSWSLKLAVARRRRLSIRRFGRPGAPSTRSDNQARPDWRRTG